MALNVFEDGVLHNGGRLHLTRKQTQLEGIEELTIEDDLHGRVEGTLGA